LLIVFFYVTDIDYFVCQKIVEILKETEVNSKNIFGFYSSQRMKDWLEIIKLYEKDNIYLGLIFTNLKMIEIFT
jgi:hypothetical protein